MDATSSVNERWKLCTIASLASCFILLVCLNRDPGLLNVELIGTTTSTLDYFDESGADIIGNGRKPVNQTQTQTVNKCNIYDGRWVFKPMENPLYVQSQCPFLSDQVSCQRNGRPDFDYEKWSWEAHDCQIPRFNGKDMLARLRGKRVIIVGDSLNRNQWESLVCLLYSVIPPSLVDLNYKSGSYKVFKAQDYNITVEFYWSPFLVQLETNKASDTKVLRLDKLDASARDWYGADIMVFNTGHWWGHRGKFRAWDFFGYNGTLVKDMLVDTALDMALNTWARWIEHNVVSTKTRVFFRSISPGHKGKNLCYNETQPMANKSSYITTLFSESIVKVVEKTITGMRVPVRYMDITKLSQLRIDAHPTVYTTKVGIMGKRGKKDIDCSHWCLPGLPDTWNRLMYASIVFDDIVGSSTLVS